jgi:AraC-like DNA-binding protein
MRKHLDSFARRQSSAGLPAVSRPLAPDDLPMIGLSGCRISRPLDLDGAVEIVWASHAVRRFPMRVSDGLGVCLKSGSAHAVRSDGRWLTYPENAVSIRYPGCVWSSEPTAAAFVSIDIAPPLLPAELEYRTMQFVPPSRLPAIGVLAARLDGAGERFSRQEAVARLVAQLLPLTRERAASHAAVARARGFLEAFVGHDLGLDDLAAAAGCDKFSLIRAFKRELGLPPYAYFLRLRLRRAQTLLARGYRPAEVATATGFADQAHFTRHFRRIVGLTPGRYARQARTAVTVNIVQDVSVPA